MRMTPDTDQSIRCTASGCTCVCFKPGSVQLRSCDHCGHGWVAHAMEKLHFQAQRPSSCGPVEVALPGLVFDLSSLVLFGAQAVPVQLKILLDRLYSILTSEQVGHILHTLGWSLGDYVRGYMLQFPSGKVLDHWVMVTPEEELLIFQQFLRFGETRPIVQLMTSKGLAAVNQLPHTERSPAPKSCQSNINTLIEQNGGSRVGPRLVASICCYKGDNLADHDDSVHHVENPDGQSLLLPFHFPSSAFHSLPPSTKDLVPASKLTRCQQKPKLTERHRRKGGRREQENDPILQPFKPALKIKADPDKPNPAPSIWHQGPINDQEVDLQRGMATWENISSLSSFSNSTHLPTSSSLHPSISSSPPKTYQKLQSSSSYSLNPLPSLSSFICPLPSSPFSSSLHPLPSSLCSLPPLSHAAGRKGRVCCGICGKSFYDKGTLKIHYNAVHLKIKHRCTVAGCTMVFSSLRSRNRHSANPNPRLHTGAGRDAHTHSHLHRSLHTETQIPKDRNDRKNMHNTHTHVCREAEISNTPLKQEDDTHTLVRVHTLTNGFNDHATSQQDTKPPQTDSPPPSPHSLPSTLSQGTNQSFALRDSGSDLHSKAFPPPPLAPAFASSLGSPPSFVLLDVPAVEKTKRGQRLLNLHTKNVAPASLHCPDLIKVSSSDSQPVSHDYCVIDVKQGKACTSPPTNQQRQWGSIEPMPKKKPRKSSMPVKIEIEKAEKGGKKDEEEN